MNGPAYVKGHTLDLVFSSGLYISNPQTQIIFDLDLAHASPVQPALIFSRIISSSTGTRFVEAFREAPVVSSIEATPSHVNAEEFVSIFNYCIVLATLDSVAALETKKNISLWPHHGLIVAILEK